MAWSAALEAGELVIADGEGALALAGVMGGAASEVRPATTRVLIESAHFAPERIRRTARRLGLMSEASYRFERGVDRDGVERAADRAVRLLEEIAGGRAGGEALSARGVEPPFTSEIALDPARVNRLLGTSLATPEIVALLARVDVRAEAGEGGLLRCAVPSHRNDLHRYQDLIEEVVRVYGCDRVPATLPRVQLAPVERPALRTLADRARDAFTAAGLHEAICLSFGNAAELDRLDLPASDPRRAVVAIANPISEEQSFLRSTPGAEPAAGGARQRGASRGARAPVRGEPGLLRPRRRRRCPTRSCGSRRCCCAASARTSGSRAIPCRSSSKPRASPSACWASSAACPSFRAGSAEPFLHPGAASEIAVGDHADRARRRAASRGRPAASRSIFPAPSSTSTCRRSAPMPAEEGQYREISQQPPVRRDLAVLVDAASRPASCSRPSARRRDAIWCPSISSIATKGGACPTAR